MSSAGQIEKRTQQRVVKLFRETLRYDYLGDWDPDRSAVADNDAPSSLRTSRSKFPTNRVG